MRSIPPLGLLLALLIGTPTQPLHGQGVPQPGSVEYREAVGPRGQYGVWLRGKPIVIQYAGSIFMHAGEIGVANAVIVAAKEGGRRRIARSSTSPS